MVSQLLLPLILSTVSVCIAAGVVPVACAACQITPQFLWVRNLGRAMVGGSGMASHEGW